MTEKKTQLLVIGAGPGGYAAAFHAADMGQKVTLIDPKSNPGGVCLYTGCIPSKTLLHVTKILNEIAEGKEYGIEVSGVKVNLKKLIEKKNAVIKQLTSGLGILTKKRGIEYIQGKAIFKSSNSVLVTRSDGKEETITFDKTIIATGSNPVTIKSIPLSKNIINSTKAFNITKIPESMLIIGGGYIGLELGSVYSGLGSTVSVVEMADSILPNMDSDLTKILKRKLSSSFKNILLNTKVVQITDDNNKVNVIFEDKNGKQTTEIFDKVLVSIGRTPNSSDLGLENTNVVVQNNKFISVNKNLKTDDANIYAIGDVIGNPMLAHKASHEAFYAVKNIIGEECSFNPKTIPSVIFTDPEIACCGLSETEAENQGLDFEVIKFPWAASGRAMTLNRTEGITKILIDKSNKEILGIGIVGPNAGELISEGVLAIEMGSTIKDLRNCIHPHPTLSETIMEAAEIFFGENLHIYKPKR